MQLRFSLCWLLLGDLVSLSKVLAFPPINHDEEGLILTLGSAAVSTSHFDAWLSLHSRQYTTKLEYHERFAIFSENAKIISQHNQAFERGWTRYSMSLEGPFADLTHHEFQATYLMESQNCSATTHHSSGSVGSLLVQNPNLGEENIWEDKTFADWRTKGIMTPVKNQKSCGSCWAFSTTGCLEAHHCLAHNRRHGRTGGSSKQYLDCPSWTGLAEQQLLDCSSSYDNHGCNGGLPSHAFEYIKDAGGLYAEKDYPYKANSAGTICQSQPEYHHFTPIEAKVAQVFNITSRDEDDLVKAVGAIGPVSVAYQVSPDFRFYSHGVYDSFNATTNQTMCKDDEMSVNHAVVAVGYGETDPRGSEQESVPYYIIRNSWGTSWGMAGHFWMLRGQNMCGVSDCASFPIVPVIGNGKDEETPMLRRQRD